ncbi:MAG TPA: amidohydrolase [Gemmatimonadales bacterium]|nr:amidohydrolase [Gemmatimonadales bacterium]
MRSTPSAVLLLGLAACSTAEPADRIFTNGIVYTANDSQPQAEAVAVKDGKVIFVGSSAEARRHAGSNTEVIDLQGKTLLPGFVDAHYHLAGVGERELTLNLEGTQSLDEFLARVKERVDQAAPGAWVVGRGWIETPWNPRRFPTRQDLDRIAPANPVFLTRADGHAGVANSAALKLAGITRATRPPAGGEILRDGRGEPTGMLIDRAQGLIGRHLPDATEAQEDSAWVVGVNRSLSLGWTQIQDAGSSWEDVGRLRRLYRDGRIGLRIYLSIRGPGESADSLLAHGASVGEFDGRFTVRTIKAAMDGALGSRGALLLREYSDAPGTVGLLTTDLEKFRMMAREALRKGIQVEVHAIGDSANRLLLNEVEAALRDVPEAERAIHQPRWRDEHTQIVDPADIPRFQQLGVIPSMQPSHAIGDLHFAPDRLGTERLAGAYAWQTLIKAGNIIAGGSDAPVERGEPLIEFYAAVARKDLKGFSGEGWHPEEAMTREQALKAFTIWPAYAAFEESERGSIEVGKWADFTVFDKDIMTVPEAEIPTAKNMMTVVNGEIVYTP